MTTTLLLDADVLCYSASMACEKAIKWDEWLYTLHVDENEIKARIDDHIASLTEKLNGDRVILALTDSVNWRLSVYPEYKAHRKKDKRKPLGLPILREYLQEQYEVFLRPTLEGDDVLGILATHPKIVPGDKVIVSIDKDFKTIPSTYYDMGKDQWHTLTEAEANYWHFYQTLTGDATDGYPGCPGVGPKTAEKLLKEDCSWDTVVKAFEKAKLGEEVALTMARVARICRHTDYDFNERKVILWTP